MLSFFFKHRFALSANEIFLPNLVFFSGSKEKNIIYKSINMNHSKWNCVEGSVSKRTRNQNSSVLLYISLQDKIYFMNPKQFQEEEKSFFLYLLIYTQRQGKLRVEFYGRTLTFISILMKKQVQPLV